MLIEVRGIKYSVWLAVDEVWSCLLALKGVLKRVLCVFCIKKVGQIGVSALRGSLGV